MRFRKKPVVIDAVRLTWATWNEVCDFAGVGELADGKPEGCYVLPDGATTVESQGDGSVLGLRIPTLEGLMVAIEGDWIIRGVAGELYPCKPEIFEATYEPADGQKQNDLYDFVPWPPSRPQFVWLLVTPEGAFVTDQRGGKLLYIGDRGLIR